MPDASFNLAMATRHANWYDLLPQVEAAMADEDRKYKIRWQAGWSADEGGWYSPCGMHEYDWEAEGYPLPEDKEYKNFIEAFYHYEKQDSED